MISVEVRTARGEVLSRLEVHPLFDPVLLGVDPAVFPLLSGLDPYGDTFFNYLQVKRLLCELDAYDFRRDELSGFMAELVELCHNVLAKPHRFLRFVGD